MIFASFSLRSATEFRNSSKLQQISVRARHQAAKMWHSFTELVGAFFLGLKQVQFEKDCPRPLEQIR